ncbi:hypothetical protein [uncultured Sphaerochaeta sp.]|uniref:hypothetical protein n=1 Tax=uncultured Sphaerochaeta sp. TaxID=886478 RepID=UPI0029CA022A|nr:hypothetical protein [uncultured Sphaerochaeta sp.]
MPGDGDQQTVNTPAGENPTSTEGLNPNGEQTGATPETQQPTTQKWMAQLPDELKGNENLSKYSSLGEALKGLLDGSEPKTKEGGEGSQETPPEIDYKFTKSFVEAADADGTLSTKLTETLKTLGLPQEQAEPIYNALVDYQNGNIEAFQTKGKEMCEKALKEEWGDEYDGKFAAMQRAYDKMVPKDSEIDKGLKMTGAHNNPFVAQLLAEIGENISEHTPPNRSSVGKQKQSGGFLSRENEAYPWQL